MEPTGDQDKETVTRRLLQCFEQGIGCADGHSIRIVDQADLLLADERPIDKLLFEFSDLVNLDLGYRRLRIGFDDKIIGMGLSRNLQAGAALAATVRGLSEHWAVTIQDLRQPHGGHTLADVAIAVEEIGVSESLIGQAGLEEGNGLLVACDIGKRHRLSLSRRL